MRTGVLIVNLGTPDEPKRGSVYRYLRQFLTDRRVIDYPFLLRQFLVQCIIAPFRSGSSAKLYRQLWTSEGSPLKTHGYALVDKVRKKLDASYSVELAMRYQNPSIPAALNKLRSEHMTKLVVFTLFPQYASATVGSVMEEVLGAVKKWEVIPELVLLGHYHNEPGLVTAFTRRLRTNNSDDYDHLIFSYHGLPKRQILKADDQSYCMQSPDCCDDYGSKNAMCYRAQCFNTSRLIAREAGVKKESYSVSFQSRLGPEEWTRPYTIDLIDQRLEVGDQSLLVCCPAFTADCLETTIEIGVEYKEHFQKGGGDSLDLVESLNSGEDWADWVTEYIVSKTGSQ